MGSPKYVIYSDDSIDRHLTFLLLEISWNPNLNLLGSHEPARIGKPRILGLQVQYTIVKCLVPACIIEKHVQLGEHVDYFPQHNKKIQHLYNLEKKPPRSRSHCWMLFWKFPFGRFEFSAHRGGRLVWWGRFPGKSRVGESSPSHTRCSGTSAMAAKPGFEKTTVTTVWVNQLIVG